jgi:hypothetical protein
METEASFSGIATAVFDGSNYELWPVLMDAYLKFLDMWEAMEEDYEIHYSCMYFQTIPPWHK